MRRPASKPIRTEPGSKLRSFAGVPRVRVEFYEGARQRAGVGQVDVVAATLGEALAAVERQFPRLAPDVVTGGRLAPHWRASVNGRGFVEDPATALSDGDAVLLLSALAGG